METLKFKHKIVDIIKKRSSWRSYEDKPIPDDVKQRLLAALQNPPLPPFGTKVRLTLLESFDTVQKGIQVIGTYGIINGAKNFIVGSIKPGTEFDLEDFGYVFHWAILMATDLGLGTCWLGGTLTRESFAQAIKAPKNEIVPAISPIGFSKTERSVVDSVVRWAAKSQKRKPWSDLFFSGNFSTPLDTISAGQYGTALEMVRLAPSASNRQPWRIVWERGRANFHLFLQRTSGYTKFVKSVDLQRVDMGIAMCHFDLTNKELGQPGRWTIDNYSINDLPNGTEYIATWIANYSSK